MLVTDASGWMQRAMANAQAVRATARPNPWVGAVVVAADGRLFDGATQPPGGPHAEIVALEAAGPATVGATLVTTLEPCCHTGRTGPCTEAIVAAGVGRVIIGVDDPDPNVAGRGVDQLRSAGIEVVTGVESDAVADQLRSYLHHRTTGRPYVLLKLAATLDGRIAAPDGTSQWITGADARADVHRLRSESDAIVVGAATVRIDDPSLTVRDWDGPDPTRIVFGAVDDDARVHPCRSFSGDPADLLDQLGSEGCVQVMVEGGADVAGRMHRAGLVDRYVIYLAPKILGGDDGRPLFAGRGAGTMSDIWTGRFDATERLGDDVRLEVVPA